MDAYLQSLRDPESRRLAADVSERVAEIFRGLPELTGFTVQPDAPVPANFVYRAPVDLQYAEIAVAAVGQMLAELVDEQPDASALVLGRTFSRTLH